MHAQQQSQSVSDPRGYVTRTYPVILDRWQSLNDLARCAARSLYAELSAGDMFRIVHRQFYRELPCPYESGSRRAFDRLIEVGLVYVVMSSKGRRGETIYRLRDATDVYMSRGLQAHAESPQQLLPFALETAEEQDLGGGIIRLFDPGCGSPGRRREVGITPEPGEPQCAKSGALECAKSGAAPNLAHAECAKSGALNSMEGPAGTEKSGQSQHGTQRRIEKPESVSPGGVAATEAATGSGKSDQLAALGQRRSDEFGTRAASRGRALCIQIQEQESLTTNQIPKSKPKSNQSAPRTTAASALAYDSGVDVDGSTEFIDALIDNSRSIHAELFDETARKILKAVRSAEAKVGIKIRDANGEPDPRYMHGWVAQEWGCHVADDAIDVESVDRVVKKIETISERYGFTNSPGAFCQSQLRGLLSRAGVDIRKARPK